MNIDIHALRFESVKNVLLASMEPTEQLEPEKVIYMVRDMNLKNKVS